MDSQTRQLVLLVVMVVAGGGAIWQTIMMLLERKKPKQVRMPEFRRSPYAPKISLASFTSSKGVRKGSPSSTG